MSDLDIDTVAVGVPDAWGRLIGKRLTLAAWEAVKRDGLSMPDFHLITDAANVPVDGLGAAGAQYGFRNGLLRPDLRSWRRFPWEKATAGVICDAMHTTGEPAEEAPRWILRRQLEKLATLGLEPRCATELEFYLFRSSYEAAARSGYRRLRPAYHRHADNDLLASGFVDDVLGDIRAAMPAAGIPVEVAQGEGGVGQFEVTLAHAEPLEMADRHVVYKHGVKALAQRHGLAATFMAKPREGEAGSSCHIHLSLARNGESALTAADGSLSQLGAAFVAGLVRFAPDFCLLYAPYANSYRRLQPGSWAPANLTWGLDNRTVLVRVCGSADARRLEFRLPGADANPYLAIAALIAAGIAGVEQDLTPTPATTGDGYAADAPRLPRELGEAVETFAASSVAADALGVPVHEHLAGLGAHERDIAWREVTDRDLVRGFESA